MEPHIINVQRDGNARSQEVEHRHGNDKVAGWFSFGIRTVYIQDEEIPEDSEYHDKNEKQDDGHVRYRTIVAEDVQFMIGQWC